MPSGNQTALLPATPQVINPARNPALVYLARLAPGSRPTMHRALSILSALITGGRITEPEGCPWAEVVYAHVSALGQKLVEQYHLATVRRILCALRGVMKEAWRLRLISAEQYQQVADVPAPKGETLPAGRALSAGELRALFASCARAGNVVLGARDAALLALCYGGLLRRAEVVALDLGDYQDGLVVVRRGKGRKDRTSYLEGDGARDAMAAWLQHRGDEPGPLLVPVGQRGQVLIRRLSVEAVFKVMRRHAAAAEVARFSPHDLRRSAISDLLDADVDLSAVQQLAGHAHISTTARYDRRGERVKRRAAGRLHVPYVRR